MAEGGHTGSAPQGQEVRDYYRELRRKAVKVERGLLLVNTGEGKGKTTAALGLAFRALGVGWRVAFLQFIKGAWKTGEQQAAQRFAPDFVIKSLGRGFTWDSDELEKDIEAARLAWQEALEVINSGEYQLVVLDELNYVISYGFLPVEEVVRALQGRPRNVHVCLTGRDAHPQIIEIADLVTEMRKVKHPFDQGILAQAGIDF